MYTERDIYDLQEIVPLLEKCGLTLNGETDCTVGLYDGADLAATGSIRDSIVQMVAVDPERQGEGLAARVVSALLSRAGWEGWLPLSLFTKIAAVPTFRELGFHLVAQAPPYAALLEFGGPGIDGFCRELQRYRRPGEAAALVMNCNPFTLGHQYLTERAAEAAETVYLFAVEEDRSVFPFAHRLELARRGTAHLPNVIVIPGGRYMISSLTFPSYFTREEHLARAHASLDAAIFRDWIAPALDIRRRFVGTEPLSPVTAVYNQVLRETLADSSVELTELPRRELDGVPVSASRVRALLAAGNLAAAGTLVPPSTLAYLQSSKAAPVLKKLQTL